jgi:hypothetical protein
LPRDRSDIDRAEAIAPRTHVIAANQLGTPGVPAPDSSSSFPAPEWNGVAERLHHSHPHHPTLKIISAD